MDLSLASATRTASDWTSHHGPCPKPQTTRNPSKPSLSAASAPITREPGEMPSVFTAASAMIDPTATPLSPTVPEERDVPTYEPGPQRASR